MSHHESSRWPTTDSSNPAASGKTNAGRLSRPLRTVATSAAAVILAVSAATAGATPAAADAMVPIINTEGTGVGSRWAPQLTARDGYGAPADASVTTLCWTRGDAVGPYTNDLWWLVSYDGRTFYVADRYLGTPYIAGDIPSETNCADRGTADQSSDTNSEPTAKTVGDLLRSGETKVYNVSQDGSTARRYYSKAETQVIADQLGRLGDTRDGVETASCAVYGIGLAVITKGAHLITQTAVGAGLGAACGVFFDNLPASEIRYAADVARAAADTGKCFELRVHKVGGDWEPNGTGGFTSTDHPDWCG